MRQVPPVILIIDLQILLKSEVKSVCVDGGELFEFLVGTKITDVWLLEYQ